VRVILSHPFSGALHWWLAAQSDAVGQQEKRPTHPYYRALYGDVDRNLDIALACAVLFEEVVLPAADAPYPGFVSDAGDLRLPALEMITSWETVAEADALLRPVEAELFRDPVLRRVFDALPLDEQRLGLLYATTDVLLTQIHEAPVLCALGRRRVVLRLLELGFLTVPSGVAEAIKQSGDLLAGLETYFGLISLKFTSETVDALAEVKWNEKIRRYAEGFQAALSDPTARHPDALLESLASAWGSGDLATHISGAFSATSRSLAATGLLPGVGTVTGLVGIGADAASALASRRAETFRWYEFGPEVRRYESLRDLEQELRRRGLRT
jgi:hypothetical protein